jgi:hypothetical protein
MHIYKSLIRPVLTYECETWVLKDIHEQQVFERKVMTKIYGPIKCQDWSWRIRTNEEIDLLIKHADIVRYIKAQDGLGIL